MHSPRKRKAKPDTGSSNMWLVSPLPERVYATSAHPKWLRPSPTSLLCAGANIIGIYLAAVATQQMQATSMPVFIAAAALGFAHRLAVYAAIGWIWYAIDYCVAVDGVILCYLWQFSSGAIAADDEQAHAQLFVVSAGIGIFALQLKSKFLLHHPESATSWWIHVGVPLWLSLAMRNWAGFGGDASGLATTELITLFLKAYMKWWLGYFGLIILRNAVSLPLGLSEAPCLVDDFMGGPCPHFGLKCKFMVGHGLLALFGGVVASFAYSNLLVHQFWVALVTASSVYHGVAWMRSCATTK